MTGFREYDSGKAPTTIAEVVRLLGARRTLPRIPRDPIEAHELLLHGLPAKALTFLVASFVALDWDPALERAIGMSLRTFQRHAASDVGQLSPEQSGRIWKLAEILAKATAVFGSREEAEQWLREPAIALNQRRPLDLLATPAGTELVEDHLTRLEYGVYA
jgi:putative toxin-antitoxin system antitoxin component (TIGR02293 family)